MSGFQMLLGVIAIDGCVLGAALLALHQLNKAVSLSCRWAARAWRT
jgi:hypothetical protein